MTLQLGAYFASWDALRTLIQEVAIKDHFRFIVVSKVSRQRDYRCKSTGCEWRVLASITKSEDIVIKKIHSDHKCLDNLEVVNVNKLANNQAWLREIIPQHLIVTEETRVQEIIDCVRLRYK